MTTHDSDSKEEPTLEPEIVGPEGRHSDPNALLLRSLGRRLETTGNIALGFAGVLLLSVIPTIWLGGGFWWLVPLLVGVYLLYVARRTQLAGRELGQIVFSEGQDVAHLMAALGQLNGLYRLKIYLVVIALGLVLLVALAGPAA